MEGLKGELVRIETKDKLELQGILYEPETKTGKVLIHIHAWVGNFYENLFLDYIAKEAVSNGFAFLSFNNRGAGFVTDFIKKEKNKRAYFRCGGSTTKFEDSVLDISAGIDFVMRRGYKNVVLEGHSLGCQKSAFYQYTTHDERVKGLIMLAPVDDIAYVKRLLGKKYDEQLELVRKMIKDGKGEEQVPQEMAFCPMLNARKYIDIADPTTIHGKIMDYSGDLKELKQIKVPVLAIFGSKDDYEKEPKKTLNFLENALSWNTKLIENTDHWFFGKEKETGKSIALWLEKIMP